MRGSFAATATLALLASSAFIAPRNYAAEPPDFALPAVEVKGKAEVARPHPQDPSYAEDRLPGCVEVITPTSGGGLGGTHQAKYGKATVSVMPSLRDPSSASDNSQRGTAVYHQEIPPGWTSDAPSRCP